MQVEVDGTGKLLCEKATSEDRRQYLLSRVRRSQHGFTSNFFKYRLLLTNLDMSLLKLRHLIMKKIILALGIVLAACSKDSNDTMVSYTPESTAAGTPVGEATTAVVGPDGGTISSGDGRMDVVFPSGAFTGNTSVTIQAVTNNIPGGKGNVYRIGPGGTTLNAKATLKFHYNDEDIVGSQAILLGVASQGPDGIWYSQPERNIDTVNKTISIGTQKLFSETAALKSTTKFSRSGLSTPGGDWGTFTNMSIMPSKKELKVNESQEFKVMVLIYPESTGNQDDAGDYLPPLPQLHEVSSEKIRRWTANGQTGVSSFGTVTPAGARCTYMAPSTKPPNSRNPVQLSAELANMVYRNPVTGRDMTSLMLVAPVKIVDDNYSFSLRLKYSFDKFPSTFFVWSLTDSATVDFDVKDGQVSVAAIHNEDGMVKPASQSIPNGAGVCTATWIHDDGATGYLNVTSASGETAPYGYDQKKRSLTLTVKHGNTRVPKFKLVCSPGQPTEIGGEPWGTLERSYSFILKDSAQTVSSFEPYVTVKLEPRQQTQ
jgi:hypothetical protein